MTATPKDLSTSRIASLTLVNAMIFQQVIAQLDSRVGSLERVLKSKDVAHDLDTVWTTILDEIDYVPIFSLARDIVRELAGAPGFDDALKDLGGVARRITTRRAALRHDLMGRVYHRLLADAKFFGAYYTSIPAATLLLKLAISPKRWEATDFGDVEALRELRILDFACGTGTLLKAALQTVTDNHIRARAAAGSEPDIPGVHKALVESALWGFDVIPFAIHLAGSALALHEPDIAFGEMNLRTMLLGIERGIHLGSLDFLMGVEASVQADLFGGQAGPKQLTGGGLISKTVKVPKLDLCVMNPPFVRSVGGNLLFGNLPNQQRKKLQTRLKKIVSDLGVPANITAGLAPVFAAMGHRFVKPGGYLALVVPRAILTGIAWTPTRQFLARNYHVEYLIVSHEKGHWNFSENTELSECLVVARRLDFDDKPGDTRVINLSTRPSTTTQALAFANAIAASEGAALDDGSKTDPLISGEKQFGEVVLLRREQVARDEWGIGAAFSKTDISRVAYHVRRGSLFLPAKGIVASIPITKMKQLGHVGPDRRDIHDAFSLSKKQTAYPAYWGHDTESAAQLRVSPNAYLAPLLRPKKGRPARDANLLWSRSGRLLVAERLWLVTTKMVAVRSDEPVLSNTWWPVAVAGPKSEIAEKALAVWLNSTIGLITVIAARVDTRGQWIDLKKPLLEELDVLNVVALKERVVEKMAAAFDKHKEARLLSVTEIKRDPVRAALDAEVAAALEVDDDLSKLRSLVASDPLFSS